MLKRIAVPLLLALALAIPTAAHAQRRSPLSDAPAIRKRVELRETRLDIGAGVASTVNETFYHGLMANVRLGFHITDWLSVSGLGAFNLATVSTGFHGRLIDTLPDMQTQAPARDFRAPSDSTANSGMNKQSMILTLQAEVTPFTGKYAMFGKLFAHYDFYLFAGGAFVNLAAVNGGASACSDTPASNGVCVVTGMKPGATAGVGFHSFFNDFLALNVELRDIVIRDNPAGRDVNGDMNADNKDLAWTSHLMAVLGLTLYLPATASISP